MNLYLLVESAIHVQRGEQNDHEGGTMEEEVHDSAFQPFSHFIHAIWVEVLELPGKATDPNLLSCPCHACR